jgi:tetratricopeptide (TPR) repeat protein
MRDGIIDEFLWVIPGHISEFKKNLPLIRKMLKNFRRQDPFPYDKALFKLGLVKTRLYNRPFYICVLETLPKIKKGILLDIDTDFLIVDSLKNTNATISIGKRNPWIAPQELVRILKKKITLPRFITIAYSVNGGFTPMVYKTIGDKVAKYFGYSDHNLGKRLLAGEYFKRFRESLDKNDFKTAKDYYSQALKLNPKYKVVDNNYGPLYLQLEKYKQAEKEFRKILKIDVKNGFSLSGLGSIYLAKEKIKKAGDYFDKALDLNLKNKTALIGLAETYFKIKKYLKAKKLISRYEKLEPMQGFSRYLEAQIYEKMHNQKKALTKYKEARQLGLMNIDLLLKLVKLSRRFDKTNLGYLKERFRDYKKNFYRLEKKALKRKVKFDRIKQIENKIRRLATYLKS